METLSVLIVNKNFKIAKKNSRFNLPSYTFLDNQGGFNVGSVG